MTRRYFKKFVALKPSGRGELEITDVNNFYVEEGAMTFEPLEGWWTDAGTFESLLRANNLVAKTGANKMRSENKNPKVIARQGAADEAFLLRVAAGFIGSNFIRPRSRVK